MSRVFNEAIIKLTKLTECFPEQRPADLKIEYATLCHWKCIMIEMQGNSCWKHHRDYKAIMTLFFKWQKSLQYEEDRISKKYYESSKKFENYTPDLLEDDWGKIENIRILIHQYLNEFYPDYKTDDFTLATEWGMQRIRELTQS